MSYKVINTFQRIKNTGKSLSKWDRKSIKSYNIKIDLK